MLVYNRLMPTEKPSECVSPNVFSFDKPSQKVWEKLALFEKIQYYGKHLTSEYAPFVDKIEAKNHAKRLCPDVSIPHVYKILEKHQRVRQCDIIPNSFFKASHGSGWNMHITSHISAQMLNEKQKKWSGVYSTRQKQYTFLTPRFFFEKKIDCYFCDSCSDIVDIKVMCIYGEPVFILVKGWSKKFYLDTEWSTVLGVYDAKSHKKLKSTWIPPLPPDLSRLLLYARQLSAPFECVRVDFYIGKDKHIYFSEFTFTPAAGRRRLDLHLEKEIGKKWTYTRPSLIC